MRRSFSFFPALENRKRSRKITSLAAHAIPGVAGQWLGYGDTLGILQQVFQVDRVVMPLPVHTYHPDQGFQTVGATPSTRHPLEASCEPSCLRVCRILLRSEFKPIPSHPTPTFPPQFTPILSLI